MVVCCVVVGGGIACVGLLSMCPVFTVYGWDLGVSVLLLEDGELLVSVGPCDSVFVPVYVGYNAMRRRLEVGDGHELFGINTKRIDEYSPRR